MCGRCKTSQHQHRPPSSQVLYFSSLNQHRMKKERRVRRRETYTVCSIAVHRKTTRSDGINIDIRPRSRQGHERNSIQRNIQSRKSRTRPSWSSRVRSTAEYWYYITIPTTPIPNPQPNSFRTQFQYPPSRLSQPNIPPKTPESPTLGKFCRRARLWLTRKENLNERWSDRKKKMAELIQMRVCVVLLLLLLLLLLLPSREFRGSWFVDWVWRNDWMKPCVRVAPDWCDGKQKHWSFRGELIALWTLTGAE